MTGILVVGSLTLLASFLCSLFEAALYAITPSQAPSISMLLRCAMSKIVAPAGASTSLRVPSDSMNTIFASRFPRRRRTPACSFAQVQ